MSGAPAFKEWQALVGALTAGEQILILRKGGIAEGRGGFAMRAERFWLFPTAFHAQREKLKPASHRFFDGRTAEPGPANVCLTAYAEVADATFVSDWDAIRRLDPFHFWTEDTVRERFTWSRPPGLHVIVVRVYQIAEPVNLDVTTEMAGCKSWIEVPAPLEAQAGTPVIDEAAFVVRRTAILETLAG